jgi:hypothetical protein
LELPEVLDVEVYRDLHIDLRALSDEELRLHYAQFGEHEGRRGNRLATREDFTALVGPEARVLEVGPFNHPSLVGTNVEYADYLDRAGLIEKAIGLGIEPATIPTIHHVLGAAGLGAIEGDYDVVLTSHCIEHQPDLVGHLADVQRLLEARHGRYFLMVPDKRYCFDRPRNTSTISEVIDAHESGRKRHSLKCSIDFLVFRTHNDAARHWEKDSIGEALVPANAAGLRAAVEHWRGAGGEYVDVHAWYFTPQTFAEIIGLLGELAYIRLVVERVYPTRFGSNEFWAVLRAP